MIVVLSVCVRMRGGGGGGGEGGRGYGIALHMVLHHMIWCIPCVREPDDDKCSFAILVVIDFLLCISFRFSARGFPL